MNFKRGKDLESMRPGVAGIQYNQNYVARSRMEEILQQEDDHAQQREHVFNKPR